MCVEPRSPAGFEDLISVSARFLLLRLPDRHVKRLFKALNWLQPNKKEIWAHCASQGISSLLQGEVEGSDGPSTHHHRFHHPPCPRLGGLLLSSGVSEPHGPVQFFSPGQ